jgi:phage N-6-adenine-methyltransferase
MNTKLMFSSEDQCWETPMDIYQKLNDEFRFTLDPCSTMFTAKCRNFFTPEDDGLTQSWVGHIVFMNPPYSRELPIWLKKAYEESENNGAIVVCLIPSRSDNKAWHQYCMHASEIRFIKGRLKFGDATNAAPFPSAVIVFDRSKPELTVSSYEPYGKVIKYSMPKAIRYVY